MANNPYVNKVEYAGQTIMDISDTTATESDVLPGKSFYKASGAKVSGSLANATQSADGLMSSTDKTKLDGIAAGATANIGTITSVTLTQGAGITVSDSGTAITSSGTRTISITGMNTSSGSTSKCLTEKGTWESFTNNTGTVTGVKINGTTKSPSSGVVDLGTVITDVSGKADNSAVVHIGGSLETITGQKKFENSVRIANGSTSPSMVFHGKDLPSANGCMYLNASETNEQKYGQCYFYFRHYSPNADGTRSDHYENFKLPAVDIGRDSTTGNGSYNILTSKSPVTIAQGGTGATTAAAARANLGAVNKAGDTMTGALTATNFTSTHYNLESIGDKTSAITSSFHISSSSSADNTVTFTMPNKSHAFLGIASGFACLYVLSGTLFNTQLPSGFSASLSGSTVTISRSTSTSFSVSGIIIS